MVYADDEKEALEVYWDFWGSNPWTEENKLVMQIREIASLNHPLADGDLLNDEY